MTTITYCFYCKRPVGSEAIPYEDLQAKETLYYHEKCWKGPVQRKVIEEYVDLIMRVAGATRHRRLK